MVDIEHNALAEFLGKGMGERAKGNLGLVRKWEGDARILLRNRSGEAAAVVGGKTKKAAQETAARIVEKQPNLHIAEQVDISKIRGIDNAEIPVEIRSTIGKTGRSSESQGIQR